MRVKTDPVSFKSRTENTFANGTYFAVTQIPAAATWASIVPFFKVFHFPT